MCCGRSGSICLDVHLDKEGFILEESVAATVVVKNDSSHCITRVCAKLEQVNPTTRVFIYD